MIKIQDPIDPVNSEGDSERKEWAVGGSVEMLEISVFKKKEIFFFKRKHKQGVIIE